MQSKLVVIALTVAIGISSGAFADGPPLDEILKAAGIEDPPNMLRDYLLDKVDAAWTAWQDSYEARTDPQAIREHYKALQAQFVAHLDGFPERTPLNPKITGVIERDGYRVEKILFESRPRHYVTALLFVPESSDHAPPYPGILVPCGHAANAKAHDTYQSVGAFLALNGMAALVFDPIDQGERAQFLDENGEAPFWGTKAHTMVGIGSMLLGRNTATYEIWDGMRGIDYLQSRPEVDPERIGCTGNSGGGTQTSFMMALDNRIDAAAPSCYLNLLKEQTRRTSGDAEQNIYGQLRWGMEHPDYVMMRAPMPVKILAATHDFFDINATWQNFRYAKRLYSRLGYSENVDLLENDAKHNYNKLQREGAVRWLARWLTGVDEPLVEPELELLTEEEALCTPEGEVMLLDGARSVYDLNREYLASLQKPRADFLANATDAELRTKVREIIGIDDEVPALECRLLGTDERDGLRIEKLALSNGESITLPAAYVTKTDASPTSVTLLLHEAGIAEACRPGGPVEGLLTNERAVVAVDVRGTGEARQTEQKKFGEAIGLNWQDFYIGYILAKPFVGMRTQDILSAADFARQHAEVERVHLVSIGHVGVPAMHAAALKPERFASVNIEKCLVSWSNVVELGITHNQLHNAVHGALPWYDLPDLAHLVGDILTLENPVDALGKPVAKTRD
ncbi:MAG: acetylxylan esterase [Candidatus Hydrogenedentota bacterium]